MIIETRNSPDALGELLKYFEYPYSEDIQNYFSYLQKTECEVLVFMARKMFRLYMAAIGNQADDFEIATPNRLVIQHNSLPLFAEQLHGKRILLCDDMAMSASAIHHHRDLLENQYHIPPENINVAVMFAQEGIPFQSNIRLAYEPVYLPLDRMRQISKSIISFIWSRLTGYVAYTPCYHISNTRLDHKITPSKGAWVSTNITRAFQEDVNIQATCYYMTKPFALARFACVRMYRNAENGNTLMIPFVLLPPLSCASLRATYAWCEKTFDLPPMPDGDYDAGLIDAAKYRIVTYIASTQLFRQFLYNYDIPADAPIYQAQDDAYFVPPKAYGLGERLLYQDNWEPMWSMMEIADLPAEMADYMESGLHPEGIPCEEIVNELQQSDTVWSFFGAMSQYDKKTTVFKNGLPETLVWNSVAPAMGGLFYPWLVACMDSAIATMNVAVRNNAVYSYLQKGEQAYHTYVDDLRIEEGTVKETAERYESSTAVLSLLRRSFESGDKWQRHLPTILRICRLYGEKNGACALKEKNLHQLVRTGIEAFPWDSRKKLREKYKEKRYGEIDFFLCLSSLYPLYADSCERDEPSIAGFIRYIENKCKHDATIDTFLREVSSYAN